MTRAPMPNVSVDLIRSSSFPMSGNTKINKQRGEVGCHSSYKYSHYGLIKWVIVMVGGSDVFGSQLPVHDVSRCMSLVGFDNRRTQVIVDLVNFLDHVFIRLFLVSYTRSLRRSMSHVKIQERITSDDDEKRLK